MNFDNKIPIAVIITVVLQAAGIIWWVSQQAHTVENLKEDVGGLSSRMAIEQNVNLRRDVAEHQRKIENLMEEVQANNMVGERLSEVLRRVSVIETEMKYLRNDEGR
jgi:predicted RNase H-like nuclease (RuvC/YqgF family)